MVRLFSRASGLLRVGFKELLFISNKVWCSLAANTIGSKCNDVEIARKVVDVKAEIEKIREQIQNIE